MIELPEEDEIEDFFPSTTTLKHKILKFVQNIILFNIRYILCVNKYNSTLNIQSMDEEMCTGPSQISLP